MNKSLFLFRRRVPTGWLYRDILGVYVDLAAYRGRSADEAAKDIVCSAMGVFAVDNPRDIQLDDPIDE